MQGGKEDGKEGMVIDGCRFDFVGLCGLDPKCRTCFL